MKLSKITPYVAIIQQMLAELKDAYPREQITLRIEETEPGGYQCNIRFTENGAYQGHGESFHINPPGGVSGRP